MQTLKTTKTISKEDTKMEKQTKDQTPANNTQKDLTNNVVDMSAKIKVGNMQISMAEYRAMQREYEKVSMANEIKLSARIKSKEIIKGKEIIDKNTGVPVVDEMGEIRHYPDTFIISLAFEGGSLDYKCKEPMYEALEIGEKYLFKGYLGYIKEFGKEVISPIFHSYELV